MRSFPFRQFNLSSSGNARANLLLRRRVDEDVKRRQLTVLRYTNVSARKPLRVVGRSIRPRKATDAMHRLSWPTDREHIVFKLREKELNNGVNLFDALMFKSACGKRFPHLASILCGTSNLELTIMPGRDYECGRPESHVTGMR